jgi:hypothetical protein
LSDCSGTCLVDCSLQPWSQCDLAYVTNAASWNVNQTWADAVTSCQNFGARLPTYDELLCMCANRSTLPGGMGNVGFWSSTEQTSSIHIVDVGPGCSSSWVPKSAKYYTKCVK